MLNGCSTFNRDWRRAAQAVPPGSVEGRWDGTWHSDANGHHGRLRAIVTETGTNTYRVHYRASYAKILRFGYTALLHAEETEGRTVFRGSADLGWLAGGVYEYEGEATPTEFHSTYRSKHDHGTYRLARPSR